VAQTRQVVFVINPRAGTHHGTSVSDQINGYLEHTSISPILKFTKAPGHARQLAHDAVKSGAQVVVAVGGDGTMNECASALIHTNTSLGLIPMGSGNGLARDLGYSMNTQKSIEVINQGKSKVIDCGSVNGQLFFCTAGLGFDATVSRKFQQQPTRGFQGYIKTAFHELLNYHCQHYQIRFDGEEICETAFSVTLANACQFGNNAYISPQADPSDGLIDLCIIRAFPKYQAAGMVYRLFSGSIHKSPNTNIHQVKKVEIYCPGEHYFHLDGETKPWGNTWLKVEIVPKALSVIVPG
jgi:YegS/Rv2252/BmrU family lipid kinase